jgi:AraC-like DNA-binding protein
VEAAYEKIETLPAASWVWHAFETSSLRFNWHFHPELELTLITAGTGRRYVGDSIETYGPGDLVLIGADLPHTYVSDDRSGRQHGVVAQFDRDFLGATLWKRPEFEHVARMFAAAGRGLRFTGPTAASVAATFPSWSVLSHTERTIALLGVLDRLAKDTRHQQPLSSSGFHPPLDTTSRERLVAVGRYLATAYAGPVSLSDVAKIAHMSPAAFSRFFRRATGRTLTRALTELRISAACRLLVDTELPIAEVAVRSGYNNLSNFNRRFRELKKMTPREYRSAFRPAPH